jgi:hypothetical protein
LVLIHHVYVTSDTLAALYIVTDCLLSSAMHGSWCISLTKRIIASAVGLRLVLCGVLQAVIPEYAPELHEEIRAAATGSSSSSSNNVRSNSSNALLQSKRKQKAVPGPARPAAAALQRPTADTAAQHETDIGAAVEQLSLGALVQALLPTDNSSSTSDTAGVPLSAALRTAVKFRLSKKMLLMDVCVAAGVPLAVLQQYQAGRVEASTCHALPWQEPGSSA